MTSRGPGPHLDEVDEVANDPRRADALPSELTPGLPLAAASRRLRRPAGRPRAVRPSGPSDQGAARAPALDAASGADFATTVPPRGLSIAQGAHYLGVSRREVYRFMEQGVLCPVRLPGRRRVLLDRRDLDALLDASKDGIR